MNNTKSNLINDFFECDLKQLKKNYRSIQEINDTEIRFEPEWVAKELLQTLAALSQ